jgi:hypothetical protein
VEPMRRFVGVHRVASLRICRHWIGAFSMTTATQKNNNTTNSNNPNTSLPSSTHAALTSRQAKRKFFEGAVPLVVYKQVGGVVRFQVLQSRSACVCACVRVRACVCISQVLRVVRWHVFFIVLARIVHAMAFFRLRLRTQAIAALQSGGALDMSTDASVASALEYHLEFVDACEKISSVTAAQGLRVLEVRGGALCVCVCVAERQTQTT